MPVKRLHYFDHQFLVEADFTDEQAYHVGMRRRLTRLFHTFGIAEGLVVNKTGAKQVTVRAGMAVDRDGREMVLEADTVLDLGNAANFPPGSTVHVTIAYDERQTDPSTSTGAPGNTRTTEEPRAIASTTAPPVNGSVVRLAQFVLTAGGDVPGAINDALDGGVRQAASARGVGTLNGIASAGGNVDLVPGGAIVITPDAGNRRILVSEQHSANTANPHNTTAAQVGAVPAAQYDLARRVMAAVTFTQADATGATRALNLGSQARLVMAVSTFTTNLGSPVRAYGGGTLGFADFGASNQQSCVGVGISRFSDTDWFMRSGGVPTNALGGASIFDGSVAPNQVETLSIAGTPTPTGLTLTLTRTPGAAALASFSFFMRVYLMGAP